MITTGSSGSYFARVQDASTSSVKTVAVFKPKDEEPYGELNPKRVFLRKYFWWALGRPCLLPNFSAFSEVGASFLDQQLDLNLVPRTRLIELSSPSFYYEYKDRVKWETQRVKLPVKVGSYQNFLSGYVNVSTFLRNHPWPSRPKSLMDQDLRDENRSHRKSRKKQKAHLRKCGHALKHLLLCRGGMDVDLERHEDRSIRAQQQDEHQHQDSSQDEDQERSLDDSFYWTTDNMREFRLELERLVVLDYLMRNTDRGLDNFMIKLLTPEERFRYDTEGKTTLVLAAIDNSLSFPHKQPDGMREYPYGWLFFPVDLIGGPFSDHTKSQFLPHLSSAAWWNETEKGLRDIFMKDEGFQEKRFEKQMTVLRGQGWNILQCLQSEEEGPIELCARQKMLVKRDVITMSENDLISTAGAKLSLETGALSASFSDLGSLLSPPKRELESSEVGKSIPVKISSRKGASSETISEANEEESLIGAQPRSLPEPDCSPWHQSHTHHHDKSGFHHSRVFSEDYYNKFNPNSKHGKRNAPPGLPRRPSLGIEVLEEIDRAAKKARRPTLAKTFTNFGKNKSSNDTTAMSRPISSTQRSNSEQTVEQGSFSESADDEQAPSKHKHSQSVTKLVRPAPNANQVSRSIEGTLASAASNGQADRGPRFPDSQDHSLMASIASLPPASTRSDSSNNVLDEEVRPRGRRRGLSIASFGTFGRSSSADDLYAQRNDGDDDGDQIKVIVERLETDSSKAWLSFF